METQFTWDIAKAEANLRKHGVSFNEAIEAFADPYHVVLDNIDTSDEQRKLAIGFTAKGVRLIAAIFIEHTESDQEFIRIISARKATRYETLIYENQFTP